MFSYAERFGKRAYCWKTIPSPRDCGERRVTSCPSMTMRPASGRSSPAISRSEVVLPQPDGPNSETNSPGLASRSTPSTAVAVPYIFSRPMALIAAPIAFPLLVHDWRRQATAGGQHDQPHRNQPGECEAENRQRRGDAAVGELRLCLIERERLPPCTAEQASDDVLARGERGDQE